MIRLLGFEIPIIMTTERKDVWGEWDGETQTITLNSLASVDQMRVTFLHELMHGIDDLLGLNLPHRTVYALSQVLFAVMVENKDLNDWMGYPLIRERPLRSEGLPDKGITL